MTYPHDLIPMTPERLRDLRRRADDCRRRCIIEESKIVFKDDAENRCERYANASAIDEREDE